MPSNTISIKPIPENKNIEQIKNIFSLYSISNVHIQGNTAYVQFTDPADLQTLQMKFQDLIIPELNNAKIDVVDDFDWNKIIKEIQKQNKKSSNNSSDKHVDLLAADIKNLIIVKDCDQQILKKLTQAQIKEIFHTFSSVNRIVKRTDSVIVQILDRDDIQLLETHFTNYNVLQLGRHAQIQTAQQNSIDTQWFTNQYSKLHKPKLQNNHQDQNVMKVLHQEIIPPFDKKTSMEVNYLNENTKYGYNQQLKHQTITEATTNQQLGYPSEIQIQLTKNQNRFGFQAQQTRKLQQKKKQYQQQKRILQQQKRKQQQQKQLLRKFQQQRLKKIELQQSKKKMEEQLRKQQQQKKKQQEKLREQQKKRQQEKQRQEKLKKQEQIKRKQEQQRKKQDEERKRQQQQKKKQQDKLREQQKKRQQEKQRQEKLKKQEQIKRKQEQQRKKQDEEKRKQEQAKNHRLPSKGQQVNTQTNFLKNTGQTIEQQLGYVVNQAKAESANLLNKGIQLLKNVEEKTEEKLGYGVQQLKKIIPEKKETLGYKDQLKQKSEQKWSVKPEQIHHAISGTKRQISKTLITVTLAIWVLYLLMQ